MKRSEINKILREGDRFIRSFGYVLPPFAHWSPEKFLIQDHKTLIHRGMGWDITDYGLEKFETLGLFLFTVRNGLIADLKHGRGMLYAEKILISRKNQVSPMHRHFSKTEDIINRGGGTLVLQLFAGAPNGSIDREAVLQVPVDGQIRNLQAGAYLKLEPGESVTLMPGIWHSFWGEKADVLIGEVSTVNDDQNDNEFEMNISRFAKVEEDETPLHLLVSDYGSYPTTS